MEVSCSSFQRTPYIKTFFELILECALVYSHYEVLVRGSGLDVIYESVRAASCAAIKPGKAMDAYSTPLKTTASVTEIRIKRLETP